MAASRVKRVSFVSRVIFDVVAAAGTPVVTAVVRCAVADAATTAQRTIKLEKNEIKRRRASSSNTWAGMPYFTGQRRMRSTRREGKSFSTRIVSHRLTDALQSQLAMPKKLDF